MRNLFKHLVAAAVVGVLSTNLFAATTIVYSNDPAPGDLFSNSGSAFLGQAVGTSGWYYNNVRYGGEVGIRTNYPFNGNGSVYMRTPSKDAKADIEFLGNALATGNPGNFYSVTAIAPLKHLVSVSYSWYRDSTSSVAGHLHPVLRILLDADGDLNTVGDRGGLVWESVYQLGPYTAPTNTWVTQTVDDNSWMWNYGLGIGFAANINSTPYAYDATLAEWKAYFPNAVIIGFNMGLGSGWTGDFVGAVDNISWTIEGITTTTNFEVVPEPTTMALFGLGLLGAAGGLLRRKSA
jgi:hypothetical protein